MESTFVRQLPRPDRAVQTTLPAQTARALRAKQSATALLRVRLSVEAIARNLFLLDPSNPRWPFSDGYTTAKVEAAGEKN